MVSIEDSRFYEHNGVDFQGIGRALVKDVLSQSAAAGRLDDHRAVRQERARSRRQPHGLREVPRGGARLPARAPLEQGQDPHRVPEHDLLRRGRLRDRGRRPHLLRHRPPRLRHRRPSPAPRCSSPGRRRRWPAIIASPSAYDPKVYPENALGRRNLVLEKMYEQGYITQEQYDEGRQQALPAPSDIEPPTLDSKAPYFTAWLRQQLVERYGAAKAFFGGLKVKSTLDLQPAGSGRRSGQLLPRLLAGDRLGGRARQPQRRDQGDGRRPELRNQALQPRHPGPPPARLLDQALHADHGAGRGDLAVHDLRIGAAGHSTSASTARKPSSSTTTRTPTSAPATSSARRPTRTTRSTPSSASKALKGKTIEDRTRSIAATIHKAGYDDPISTNPAMVLGGLEGRRDARSAGPTPTRRSATTATASAAPWRRARATAPSPTPRSPTRTATRSRAATTTRSTTR